MSLIIKQKIDIIIKNFHFKLSANNITPFTFKKFFLKKIKSNIKADIFFFYSLIKKVSGIKKVNAANSDKNIFATTFLVIKKRKNHQF